MTDRSKRMERLHELLADHELGLLDATERAEMEALVAELESEDPTFDVEVALRDVAEDLALTHAALATASTSDEALPADLQERVLAQAGRHFGWAESSAAESSNVVRPSAPAPTPRASFGARLGWVAALAAGIALVVVTGAPGGDDDPPTSLDAFVASVDDEIVAPWGAAQELGEGVEGEVAWSPSLQTGVMRFEGLKPNDPTRAQYQLWIIDGDREGQDPVDGGVFDVPSDGVVEVPIDAKLAVGSPKVFAVTVEQPGGVVVSDQSQLFLAATVKDA